MTKLQQIQSILGVTPDGVFGPESLKALRDLMGEQIAQAWTRQDTVSHIVLASTFADPGDVAAFRKAKAEGMSDEEAFKVGDNGIGKWGDDTTADVPMCALPPEDWEPFADTARGKLVIIERQENRTEVTAQLRDTMPHRANITNGAGIDLNPAACRALGIVPPALVHVSWRWA